jgi:hypothetical protein
VVCHARPLRHCQGPIEFDDAICEQRLPNEKFCHRTEVPVRLNSGRGCRGRMRSCHEDKVSLPRPGSDGSQARAAHTCAGSVGLRQMRAADVRLT